MTAGVRWVSGGLSRVQNYIWQVEEMANAIEREGEELQGLSGQLKALLEEREERDTEVRENWSS